MSCRMSVYQEAELNQELSDTTIKNGLLRKYWWQISAMIIIWNTLRNLGDILMVQLDSPQPQQHQYFQYTDQWSKLCKQLISSLKHFWQPLLKKIDELWYLQIFTRTGRTEAFCIMPWYVNSFHICINTSNEMQLSWLLFQELNSTCFGRSPCPSSGVTLLQMQPLV
jgi:hypothetical protein